MSEASPRILIVEDEPTWQRAIMRCELLSRLRQRDPASVVTVENYEAARDQLDTYSFDLAITDVVLDESRSQYDWRSLAYLLLQRGVPIVVISAYLDMDITVEMINKYRVAGVFDKAKLDLREFEDVLKRLLEAREHLPLASLGYGDITWLHLSDLHFAHPDQYPRKIVIEALWGDLERHASQGLCPGFIVVTGDIAYSGRPEEYELASQFFDRLLDQTEVPKERLFLIPGNHDVDRSKIVPLTRTMDFNHRDSVREVLEDQQACSAFMQRFDGYASFIQRYFSGSADSLAFDSKHYSYSRTFEVGALRLTVIGLNSAWVSGNVLLGEQVSDKGQLVVGEKQVVDALKAAKDADVRIAIMHHPLSYLRDFDRSDVETVLSRSCHFLLHGHLHESDIGRTTSLKGDMVVIPAGAIYQGRELVNSYNYVTLDFENRKARGVFRRYSDVQREWLQDLDTTGEARGGELEFDLQL